MSWLDGVRARLRFLLGRATMERELEDEIAFHLERETEANLARGMDADEAVRAARLSFGGGERVREEVRGEWTGVLFTGVRQDLRRAVRRLRQQPGFSLVIVVTLGIGIGANTAIFSLVRGVLLQPLPYAEPEHLVMVWSADRAQESWLSLRELVEYRAAMSSFEQLAGYTQGTATLVEGEPERVRAASVTPNTFGTLGAPALHGRTFTVEEGSPGRDDVVLLGHGVWQRHFGGAADIIGQQVRVSGVPRTVVGIMPPGFRLPLDYREERPTELWMPAAFDVTQRLSWGDRSYYIIGRLGAGVSAARATLELAGVHAQWERAGHVTDRRELARVAMPMDELLLGDVRPALWILFGAVGFLLLIACANVAHLLLARSDAQRREVATQGALGASRFRIARQLLLESGLLAVLGAALGIVLAYGGLRAAHALTPVNVIRMRGVTLDVEVLAFAAVLAVATTLGAGLLPALQLSRVALAGALASARGEAAAARRGVRRLLVAGETALSLVLVVGAVLVARSFIELRRVDLGFRARDVLTLSVVLPVAGYEEGERVNGFFRELVQRVQALPGVAAAGAVRVLPLANPIGDWSLTIENRPAEPGENLPADWQIVTPGYFESLGLELVRGRFITTADHEGAPPAAVINETMAARYWPEQDAIGKRFHLGTLDQPWIEVVGIARDVRRNAVLDPPRPEMYVPHEQWGTARGDGRPQRGMSLVVRTRGEPLAVLPLVREQVRALDPNLPVSDVRSLEAIVAEALAEPRFTAVLLGVFAALALALAATGLYGVISFVTARRTHEIGVRIAFGAEGGQVARLVMREGLAMAAAGVAIGLVGCVWLTRLLGGQLYGVVPLDPATFAFSPAILLIVAALAAYLPARRAARMSPLSALRGE